MAGTVGLTLWSPSVGQERPLQEEPSSHRSYPAYLRDMRSIGCLGCGGTPVTRGTR